MTSHRFPHRAAGAPIDIAFIRSRSAVDEATGCWLWQAAVHRQNGYAVMRVGRTTRRVHRVAFTLTAGSEPPRKMDVCHRCDVRHCVNPEHLFLGTRADNMRDCANKGRIRTPGADHAGDNCPASKLTAELVRSIRADPRSNRALGRLYGVTHGAIGLARRGLTWRSA